MGPVPRLYARVLNVPGVVLGFADNEQVVYTSEPLLGKGESATLYRLKIISGEALVTAKRTLPGRYGDVRLFGDVARYIEQGADSCTPGAVHSVALDETLTDLGSTPLTGGNWDYVESDGDNLLGRGPNYDGYALFDVTQAPAALGRLPPTARSSS